MIYCQFTPAPSRELQWIRLSMASLLYSDRHRRYLMKCHCLVSTRKHGSSFSQGTPNTTVIPACTIFVGTLLIMLCCCEFVLSEATRLVGSQLSDLISHSDRAPLNKRHHSSARRIKLWMPQFNPYAYTVSHGPVQLKWLDAAWSSWRSSLVFPSLSLTLHANQWKYTPFLKAVWFIPTSCIDLASVDP